MLNINTDWLIIDKLNIGTIDLEINKIIKNNNFKIMEDKSSHGKNSKQYNLTNHLKKNIVTNLVAKKIKELLLSKFKSNFNLNLISAWSVKGQEHGYHTLHKHDYLEKKLHIASVVYLSTPKMPKEEITRETNNFYCLLNNGGNLSYYTYRPVDGDIMVFPVWLWHGAYPQSKGLRQTLNIDFEAVENLT